MANQHLFACTHCHVTVTSKQGKQCTYKVTLRRALATIVAVEEQLVLLILSVCVALLIQYAMRMRHIVIRDLSFKIFIHFIS